MYIRFKKKPVVKHLGFNFKYSKEHKCYCDYHVRLEFPWKESKMIDIIKDIGNDRSKALLHIKDDLKPIRLVCEEILIHNNTLILVED